MLKCSFVLPTHNCAGWLHHAVDSCLTQNYKNIEVVVVDDASTDSTPKYFDYLKSLNDDRIKLIQLPENKGRSNARNEGNKVATGDIICVLDSDDMAFPQRAGLTVAQFEKGVKYLYASAVTVTALGDRVRDLIADTFNKEKSLSEMSNGIVHSTVAYTKDIAMEFPYRGGEISELGIDDFCQQTEIMLSGIKLDFIPNIVTAYRALITGVTMQRDNEKVMEAKKRFLESLKTTA